MAADHLSLIQAMVAYLLMFESNSAPHVTPDDAGIDRVQYGPMEFDSHLQRSSLSSEFNSGVSFVLVLLVRDLHP